MKKIIAVLMLSACAASGVMAATLYTGEKSGAYYQDIGPKVRDYLGKGLFRMQMAESPGSTANIAAVADHVGDVGLARRDVYALYNKDHPGKVAAVDTGVRSCLYAVTKAAAFSSTEPGAAWGNILKYASRVRVALPNEKSGANETFRYLLSIDPDLGRIRPEHITNYASTDQAIDAAANGKADLAFFVQFPDPTNERFHHIKQRGMSWIGVGSHSMARQKVAAPNGGEVAVYNIQTVPVESTLWGLGTPQEVTTMCTDVIIVTADPAGLQGRTQSDQAELLKYLVEAPKGAFEPDAPWFESVKKSLKPAGKAVSDAFLRAVETAKNAVK